MKNYIGLINLDENEDRITELTRNRPLASIPFAGRYRIIDFILSNMTNSGIENVGLFAKNKSRSLVDHLNNGKPWDLDRKRDGLRVFNFAEQNNSYDDISVFAENLEYFKFSKQKYVLLAPSYMIANINFNEVEKFHENNNNDVTILYKKINNANSSFINCKVLNINEEGNVVSVGENIGSAKEANICMEMFIMKKDLFTELIYECMKTGMYKKIKECIYGSLNKFNVKAYEFKGYLACINSLQAYYETNMELLNFKINSELFNEKKPIYTKNKDEAPTRYSENSKVLNSIIANGCNIEGEVENCIIGRRVNVEIGVKIKDCIILPNCIIGRSAKLTNVITDKYSHILKNEELIGAKRFPLVMERDRRI